MNLDGTIIKDKPFTLKVPKGIQNKYSKVSAYGFVQVLDFENSQKIILIYIPQGTSHGLKSIDVHYKKFVELCKKQDIAWIFDETAISRHGHFRFI